MAASFPLTLAPQVLFRPQSVFTRIAERRPGAAAVFFQYALWLGLAPPVSAFFGTRMFGWLAGGEPLALPAALALQVSIAYYAALLAGFVFAGLFLRWMLPTYRDAGANSDAGACFALVAVAGTPLMAGGIAHLYPSLVLNILVFTAAFLWSALLLYRGVPVAFAMDAERGMLLASSMIAALLVMVAGFLGVIVVLWVNGFGPPLGI
ncbi:MAG: Yip1 family protein [Gammaproteobacteria bacterium]|nr:Yip1 family protein [Gammaproteobacteria bacterium]